MKRSSIAALVTRTIKASVSAGLLLAGGHAFAQAGAGTYTHYTVPSADKPGCTLVSVELKVESLDTTALANSLFFPAIQVNLGNAGEGAHLGPQRVNSVQQSNWGGYFIEFTTPGYRYTPFFNSGPSVTNENQISSPPMLYNPAAGVSVYVGHFDPGTYTQVNSRPASHFNWTVGTNYKLVVYRGGQTNGYWSWEAWIDNLDTGVPYFIGAVYSKANYIDSSLVWVETSITGSAAFDVRYKNPRYVTNGVLKTPAVGSVAHSANPNDSVVAPVDYTSNNQKEVWHRNGILVPATKWKALGYGDDNTW
ncbi:hypothetical protein OKA05_17310 [Luteolibacter arcticus]|uniref:Uncharacterized protein n=1 Tax=Luteolibacter arcticus TaxID=1581411 RepID=A0ABT3GLE4_9BACT|nr:hypothetical protein [Luteolibacter arcticus]MCW1924328.1 hypothetical protein [Luteolibacter arcticus]